MRPLICTFALATAASLHAQTPTFQWAKGVGNIPITDAASCILAVADDGAAYISGGNLTGSPGQAIAGNTIVDEPFLARYDVAGNMVWWKSGGGGSDLATSGSNEIYVCGTFHGTAHFGGTTLTADSVDAYLLRYDALGNLDWARQIGGAGADRAYSVAVDGLGRVHVGGTFQNSITIGTTTLVATQDTTGFLATYDAAGNVLWAVLNGGADDPSDICGYSVTLAADAAGRTYAIGGLSGTGTFGTLNLTSVSIDDAYLACYESDGTCSWVKRMGGQYNRGIDVGVTPDGNIYALGSFYFTATFDGITVLNSNAGNSDIFLAMYNANGDCQWAQDLVPSFFNDYPYAMDVDASGDAWVTGEFSQTTGVFGAFTINVAGPFLARYDENGTALSAERSTTAKGGITLGLAGDIYMAGSILGGAYFDMVDSTAVNSNVGYGTDAYLAHYDQNLELDWVRHIGAHRAANDSGNGIVTDAGGNVYTTGHYVGSAIFCADTMHEFLAASCIFINKRDASGNCVWTRSIGTSDAIVNQLSNSGTSIALDGNGDLYVAGLFADTVLFGGNQLVSAGGTDLFLAKYDANGNCLWARRGGGSGNDEARSVGVDANGNVVVAGFYAGTADIGTANFTSLGYADGLLARYDSDGNFQWARTMGGINWDQVADVAVDAAGNCYLTGSFGTSASFGPITITGTSDGDLFVAQYDANGDPVWVKGTTGTGSKYVTSIVQSSLGYLYITGSFSGTADFCTDALPGDPIYAHAFLACYSTSGNELWARQFQSSSTSQGTALAARPGGNVVLIGDFYGSTTIGGTTLTCTSIGDMMIAAFEADGTSLWAKRMGGGSLDYSTGTSIATDANSVYLTGGYGGIFYDANTWGGSITFEPGDPSSTLQAHNSSDVFVTRYDVDETVSVPITVLGCDGALQVPEASEAASELLIAPNPVDRSFTLTSGVPLTENSAITVRDVTGRTMPVTPTIRSGGALVDASGLKRGAYMITVRTPTRMETARFVKQ